MVIGCLSLDLLIPGSNSLKDKRRVIKSLKDKIRSSFNVSVIEAPSDKWQRAKLAFYDGVVDEGTINLCSALAASEHGDARRALDLLRVAGELAEREGSDKIYERHVREAERRIEYDRVMEVMKNLPLHSKLIMCSLYFLEQSSLEYSITGDIYDVYNHLCSLLSTFTILSSSIAIPPSLIILLSLSTVITIPPLISLGYKINCSHPIFFNITISLI